ncbi:MAG: helix-turn-helix domain-containing protein [bacterium]|nr:helix-turn-helix domain-containing protein [bacterium]
MSAKKKEMPMSIDMLETGKRLRSFRRSLDITLSELARKAGLSIGIISEMETGKNKPSPQLMYTMHQVYGLNLHWLLTGAGDRIVSGKKDEPPRNEVGMPTDDIDMLYWYMDRSPFVRHSILSYFVRFYYENQDFIENILKQKDDSQPTGEPEEEEEGGPSDN